MEHTETRPARADAIRNRSRILDAARQQITMHGPNVGMDEIASAAGVAVGTLYRHFPTKSDLVAAVISAFVSDVADGAEAAVSRVAQGSPAFLEFAGLLGDIVLAAASNHAVKAAAVALNADVDHSVDHSKDVQRARNALQQLIEGSQADRALRDDLSISDFYLLVGNAPVDEPPEVLQRWVDLTLFGMVGQAGR
jgi:AcrR family transcriptional regulator